MNILTIKLHFGVKDTRKIMQEIVEKLEAMGFALRGDKPKKNG